MADGDTPRVTADGAFLVDAATVLRASPRLLLHQGLRQALMRLLEAAADTADEVGSDWTAVALAAVLLDRDPPERPAREAGTPTGDVLEDAPWPPIPPDDIAEVACLDGCPSDRLAWAVLAERVRATRSSPTAAEERAAAGEAYSDVLGRWHTVPTGDSPYAVALRAALAGRGPDPALTAPTTREDRAA